MWNKIVWAVVLAGLGLAFISSSDAVPRQTEQTELTSWRHLAFTDKGLSDDELTRQINRLGGDGWQLVDVENFPAQNGASKTVYYFKRPG